MKKTKGKQYQSAPELLTDLLAGKSVYFLDKIYSYNWIKQFSIVFIVHNIGSFNEVYFIKPVIDFPQIEIFEEPQK